MNETVSTRSSRNRRVVALMGWGCLVITSFFLWNARQSGSIRAVTDEPVAFILAAFSAFVGVFAWMLYNPGRRTAAASPSLFFAALATLFPPSIIGFCLMPVDSPLRWWLALGLFLLCVVAVLSHVPDEFFGVPRGRSSYFTPMPAFDRVEGTVLDPNASWFTLEDLTKVVLDAPRQSLAPRAYLQRGESSRPVAPVRAEVRQVSEVDDILGTDFDLGLLDDDFDYDDRPARRTVEQEHQPEPRAFREPTTAADRGRRTTTRTGGSVYNRLNPDSGRLRMDQRSRREAAARLTSVGYSPSRTTQHASTLRVQPTTGRGTRASLSAFGAAGVGSVSSRLGERRSSSSYRSPEPATPVESAEQITRRREDADRQIRQREQAKREQAQREQAQREQTRREQAQREETERAEVQREAERRQLDAQRREEARQLAAAEAEAKARTQREQALREREASEARARRDSEQAQRTRDSKDRKSRSNRSDRTRSDDDTAASSSKSGLGALPVPIPFDVGDDLSGPPIEDKAQSQQLFGQTIQRDSSSKQTKADNTTVARPKRRSRYDDDQPEAAEPIASTKRTPVQTSSLKKQQQDFERTRDEDGSELVEGVMQIHFDKGQKRANVHIPFSPPLPGMPEVDCECVGGEDLRLKVPVRQSYGIRIEARRSNADEPLDAEVGFAAVYTDG